MKLQTLLQAAVVICGSMIFASCGQAQSSCPFSSGGYSPIRVAPQTLQVGAIQTNFASNFAPRYVQPTPITNVYRQPNFAPQTFIASNDLLRSRQTINRGFNQPQISAARVSSGRAFYGNLNSYAPSSYRSFSRSNCANGQCGLQ